MVRKVRELCRYINEHADQLLSLAKLGRRAGISPWHLQRNFKAVVGVSPSEFAGACRLKSLKPGLRERPSVADAVYGAGFGSSSRVYEQAAGNLGMTPGQYRKGGMGVEISYAIAPRHWACCSWRPPIAGCAQCSWEKRRRCCWSSSARISQRRAQAHAAGTGFPRAVRPLDAPADPPSQGQPAAGRPAA